MRMLKFTIVSTSPGVSAKFSDDGKELIVKGAGDVSIRIKYDDNPGYAGEDVDQSLLLAKSGRRREKYGEETHTINVGKNDTKEVLRTLTVSKDRKRVNMKDGHGDDILIQRSLSNLQQTRFLNSLRMEENWSMMVTEK